MAKPIKLKTSKSSGSVNAYMESLTPKQKTEAKQLLKIFKEVTKTKPSMWGSSIVGFGEYTYYRSNGDEGKFLATGFSIRKSGPTLYIMPGYQEYSFILEKLGPHKLGKSCLYLKNLDNIDTNALKKLIRTGLRDLAKSHKVTMH
tara:strand:+ start:35308 stop:35742 length:435 start_codon:yes stop_codon:yes gene_type:complete